MEFRLESVDISVLQVKNASTREVEIVEKGTDFIFKGLDPASLALIKQSNATVRLENLPQGIQAKWCDFKSTIESWASQQ